MSDGERLLVEINDGITCGNGANWIIRNNMIRNVQAPSGQLAGYAVLSWFSASNTTVEGNTFVNCQRESTAPPEIDKGCDQIVKTFRVS